MAELCLSDKPDKKYMVRVGTRTIHFGASGYSDFTKHKDVARRNLYLQRHAARENWGKSGIATPGFWSRWLLWNKDTLKASISDTERRFSIKIRRC